MAKRLRNKKRVSEVAPTIKDQVSAFSFGINSWKQLLQALLIVGASFWVFWPVLHGDWIWDDPFLIVQSTLIHDPAGLWKIWFQPNRLVDYQPITVSVEWIEWRLWGYETLGYHLANIILHVSGALLVWRLFSKLGLRLAWLGGLIFAIHPLQVESVAWISEIKNVLSLPPFLLAMCAWIDYKERRQKADYFLALGWFLVAMLCKTTMVMFPLVILLYAWWKQGLIGWSNLKISAPFFIISLILGLITIWFSHNDPDGRVIPMGGFFSRLACIGITISFYFSKFFLPVKLIPIYPPWSVDPPLPVQFLLWPLLGGIIYWFWGKRESWGGMHC